jgi:site-specific DNA recombinase
MNKAIGYIRVSTEQQADEGVSLAAQRAKIEAWCMANNYELADIYIDSGISGKSMEKRQGLKDALAAVKKGGVLIVYSLSRLARSTKDTLAISEQLDKAGADLVSLSERIDTTGAAGKMMFRMLAVLAEFERDVIAERTTSAMRHKKAVGEVYSPIPYGFQAVDGKLQKIESEAQVVAEIIAMRNEGKTLRAIASDLNQRGIEAKRNGKWYASTVKYLIERQAA